MGRILQTLVVVLATSAAGCVWSTPGDPAEPPSEPNSLDAVRGDGQVELSWTAPSEIGGADLSGYTITVIGPGPLPAPAEVSKNTFAYVVTGLQNGTSYIFHVRAQNSGGEGPAASINATPATVPSAPVSFAAERGDAHVLLSWLEAPDGGSVVLDYTVTVLDGISPVFPPQTLSATTLSLDVTGLENGVSYDFLVHATNEVGDGLAAMLDAVPATIPSAPVALTAEPGDQHVLLSWLPASSDGGAAISGYTITVLDGTTPVGQPAMVSGTSHDVTLLVNGTTYSFDVFASNDVGDGPIASIVSAPGIVPSAPPGLAADPEDAHVVLTWMAATDNGGFPVSGYTITGLVGPTIVFGPVTVSASTFTYDVTGLANATTYTFRVRAANSVGAGPASMVVATPAAAPEAPEDLTAVRGDQHVLLSWLAPFAGGSPITSYTVRVFDGLTPVFPPVVLPASTLTYDVTGLANGTSYTFRVNAANAVTAGPFATVVATPATSPSPPTGLVVKRHPARVEWTPAFNGGAPLTSYTVRSIPLTGSTSGSPTVTVAGTRTVASMPNLPDLQDYRFEVIASNVIGASTPVLSPGSVTIGCSVPGIPSTLVQQSPWGVVVEDFDDDGILDEAISLGGDVRIYNGLGDGLFSLVQTTNLPETRSDSALAAVDRTGDGVLDLVLAFSQSSPAAGNHHGLTGLPNGTFVLDPGGSANLGSVPTSITRGDFDGNGTMEVVAGGEVAAGIGATFGTLPSEGDGSKFVAAGDLDDDGFDDLMVVNVEAIVEVRWGAAAMSLSTADVFVTGGQAVDVAMGDFNEDGLGDIVTANQDVGLSYLRQTSSRMFAAPVPLAVTLASTNHLAVADFDVDGNVDIAVSDALGFQILLGNGNGTFDDAGEFGFPSATFAPVNFQRMLATDIDNDGRIDILIADQGASRLLAFRGNGDGTFPAIPTYAAPNSSSSITGFFDGDTILDVVTVSDNFGNVQFFAGVGDGTFVAGGSNSIGPGGLYPTTADFNEDGELDLAISTNANTVVILLGNGDGTFDAPTAISTGDARHVVVTDVNEDDHLDLVVEIAGAAAKTVLLTGDGAGAFVVTTLIQPSAGLAIADLDGDTHVDVLTAKSGVPTALFGDGTGAFTETVLGSSCRPRLAGDLNGDGVQDLVGHTSAGIGGTIDVCFGITATTFASPVNVTVGSVDPHSIVDIDADGLLDIFTTNEGYFVLNDGAGGFTAHHTARVFSRFPAIADMSGDGFLDLAVAQQAGELRIFVQPCF